MKFSWKLSERSFETFRTAVPYGILTSAANKREATSVIPGYGYHWVPSKQSISKAPRVFRDLVLPSVQLTALLNGW